MAAKMLKYALAQDVRLFYNGQDEIRIRKGVWNYTEATLNMAEYDEPFKAIIVHVFNDLNDGKIIDGSQLYRYSGIDEGRRDQIREMLEALRQQYYLVSPEEQYLEKVLSVLFGNIYRPFEYVPAKLEPALVFTDNPHSQDIARQIAAEMNYPIDVLDDQIYRELITADFTTKTDAIDTLKEIERLQKYVAPYSVVIGCLEKPGINFLRNLNRVLVKAEKPLVLSMIDGPFLTFLTINPPQTGCFECYENRLMARVENLAVYQNFVSSSKTPLCEVKASFVNPLLYVLVGMALSDGFLLSTVGVAKGTGRVINIYLPILEIQVQDLMRIPYCPACGYTANAEMGEMFTSSKMIMKKLLENIDLAVERK